MARPAGRPGRLQRRGPVRAAVVARPGQGHLRPAHARYGPGCARGRAVPGAGLWLGGVPGPQLPVGGFGVPGPAGEPFPQRGDIGPGKPDAVPRHSNGHDPHWLQGFPDRVTPPAPSGPGWRHRRRDRPQRRACTALRDTRAPPGPAPRRAGDPVGGPLAAARHTGRAAGIPVKGRECVTAQGSEVEDCCRAPTELAARYSGATRTQPHEPSRSAGAIRSDLTFSILLMLRGSAMRGWPWRVARRARGSSGVCTSS